MTTMLYEPENTTASAVLSGAVEHSMSPLPPANEFILVQAGWLPREQEYYWSEEWQAAERESLAQLAAGEGIEFDNAADLIRWLFSTEE
jgi:hypothetical protein